MFEKYNKYKTEKEQLDAIEMYGPNILGVIRNPSEKVQLEAIAGDPRAIRYIHNPSEKIQLTAVKRDEYAIERIDNPTEKVIRYLIENFSYDIEVMYRLYAKIDFNELPDDLKLLLEINCL